MKIARLIIKNYGGIAAADIKVPPAGIVIKGGNHRGKTSILRALKAVLLARGIDPSAIRLGEDKSEILVDMDKLSARRTIRASGSPDLVVTDGVGTIQRKPQTVLDQLFGRDLDPLGFYLADDKARRRMIYDVIPMTVTGADMQRWTQQQENVIGESADPGLEVIERFRAKYYALRTTANAAVEAAQLRAQATRVAADKLVLARGPAYSSVAPAAAQRALDEAQRRLNELAGKQAGFEQARKVAAPTREKIASLRELATAPIGAVPQLDLREPGERVRVSAGVIAKIEQELRVAKEEHEAQVKELAMMEKAAQVWREMLAKREDAQRQSDELEASLAGVAAMVVPADQVDGASEAVKVAAAALIRANDAEAIRVADDQALEAKAAAGDLQTRAKLLDEIVRTLTTVAPRELAERNNGIPGLTIGETIALDGIPIDTKSGQEQLQFAVDLAKRARTDGKVLLVDGLERLDDEEFADFVKLAVADGWQLIGTRVTGGELTIEAITEGDEP